jgi:pimeloyl-ACP methyl ester carboxylesterase
MVGMWLAGEAPGRLERLVLCCTSARFAPEAYDSRARTVRADGVGAIADAVVDRWFTPAFRASRQDVVEWAQRMLIGTPTEGYAGCCEAVRDADLGGRLGAISASTLVIAGVDDPAAPPDQAELIRDSIPGASLEVVPDAAHLANVERPEAITQAILDHLCPVLREGR